MPGWPERVAILYGGRRHDWPEAVFHRSPPFPVELIELPTLDYDASRSPAPTNCRRVAGRVSERRFPATTHPPLHNHSIGKNASLPGALDCWLSAAIGCYCRYTTSRRTFGRQLSHLATALGANEPRDLAGLLYPRAGMHYCVLSAATGGAGCRRRADDRLHLVPNPVPNSTICRGQRGTAGGAAGAGPEGRCAVGRLSGTRHPPQERGRDAVALALGDRNATFAVTLSRSPGRACELRSLACFERRAGLPCRFDTAA